MIYVSTCTMNVRNDMCLYLYCECSQCSIHVLYCITTFHSDSFSLFHEPSRLCVFIFYHEQCAMIEKFLIFIARLPLCMFCIVMTARHSCLVG